MTLVTSEKNNVQYKLWHSTYLCQMRAIDTMSVDYIKIFGVLDSGDSTLNNASINQLEYRRLTPIEMIKYFDQGVSVYIKNPVDCKEIYILIQTHLMNWAQEAKMSLRPDAIPKEELRIMENFAQAIYEHAKWYLDDALAETPFARTIGRDSKSVLNLLKNPNEAANKDENGIVKHPPRRSLADVFVSSAPAKMYNRYEAP